MRRLNPALTLFFLSPLIAEYLLGSMSVSMLPLLPLMAMLYGSGAVVIRELVRRSGRGWPSLLLLATAYGLIEEGLVTQSLFNPNYLHLRLLDYGWIPSWGTSAPWLVYVVSLHIFWSISVPVGLTEALFPERRDQPWLGKIGIGVFVFLFLLGSAAIGAHTFKDGHFMASPAQLTTTVVAAITCMVAAFVLPFRSAPDARPLPAPAILFLASFLTGSAFMALEFLGNKTLHLPGAVVAGAMLGTGGLLLGFMLVFTRGQQWSGNQKFAVTVGGLAVYYWFGFPIEISLHGTGGLPGHIILAVALLIPVAIAGRRTYKAQG